VDTPAPALIDRVRSSGIKIDLWKGTVKLNRLPSEPLLSELRSRQPEIYEELWRQQGRVRQARAMVRLAEDRAAWIEESRRLGKYREPSP
jgi:hypothetical protein